MRTKDPSRNREMKPKPTRLLVLRPMLLVLRPRKLHA
jgi:hypothetical protein